MHVNKWSIEDNRSYINIKIGVQWSSCILTITLLDPKMISLCHHYRDRPTYISVQSDQALYCWLAMSQFHLAISKIEWKLPKLWIGQVHLINSAGYGFILNGIMEIVLSGQIFFSFNLEIKKMNILVHYKSFGINCTLTIPRWTCGEWNVNFDLQ